MIEEMAEYVWSREAMNKNYMRNTVYHLIIAIFFRHEGGFWMKECVKSFSAGFPAGHGSVHDVGKKRLNSKMHSGARWCLFPVRLLVYSIKKKKINK